MEKHQPPATGHPSLFRTRATDLFGIRLPVVASGLMWLANADYVGAAVNAGLMGFMTAAGFPEPEALRAEIRRCRDITGGKPFGGPEPAPGHEQESTEKQPSRRPQ